MFKYAIGVLIAIILVITGVVIWRTGALKPVEIASGQQGPFLLVYKEHMGPYHTISTLISEVEADLKSKGLGCPVAFGRYLDDPKMVEHDRLRAHAGCVFQALPSEPWQDPDYEVESLAPREYILATFNGSPSIGPFKVYPRVTKWMAKYGYEIDGPVIELYKTLSDQSVLTTYLFPFR